MVGLIYTAAGIASVIVLFLLPKILKTFGNYRAALSLILFEVVAILVLGFTTIPIIAILSLISVIVLIRSIGFSDDIFLESLSEDKSTGGIRGFFLTATNSAWVISPLIAGYILGNDQYGRLYLSASLFLIPLFIVIAGRFNNFKDPDYRTLPAIKSFHQLERRSNIRKIILSNVVLRFFYSWMVIYAPIYLHQHLGFAWEEVGLVFTIMLLPFILLEYPLGWLADKRFGEKEMLSIGFIILAVATASLSFITSRELWVWAALLFMTRVGASFVESMSEIYFFKKVDGESSNLISFFRMTAPLAYLIGPLVATFLLYFIDIRYLFLALGVMILWGLRYSLTIQDTR